MQIAVLVDCFRLAVASAYNSLRLVFEIDSYATVFCFNVNECYEMFREHRMCNTSYFNFDTAVIKTCDYRYVFLIACIHSIRNKFLHLLAAAYYRHLGINKFLDHIAAVAAFIEFYSHNIIVLEFIKTGLQISCPDALWLVVKNYVDKYDRC